MKTIQELIEEGIKIKTTCAQTNIQTIVRGDVYADWLTYCERLLRQQFPDDPQTIEFCEIARKANGNDVKVLERLIGILKAFADIPPIVLTEPIDITLKKICTNFHKCARSILNRHSKRATLEINDEYDVQDLLQGILRLFIDDIRPEDYVPSYAGGNSRIDFYLPKYETYIETKMTREGLRDKEVGEQLAIDIARYGDKCKTLVCFIYDKGSFLSNPYGLISDLEAQVTGKSIYRTNLTNNLLRETSDRIGWRLLAYNISIQFYYRLHSTLANNRLRCFFHAIKGGG